MSRPILVDYSILTGDAPLAERVPAKAWGVLTDAEIARRAGVSRERVRQVRAELGLPPSLSHKRTRPTWHIVLQRLTDEDWAEHSAGAVSEALGIPESFIAQWRVDNNKPPSVNPSPLHEVTDEEWRTVPRHELAKRFGTSETNINMFMLRNNKPRLQTGQGAQPNRSRRKVEHS